MKGNQIFSATLPTLILFCTVLYITANSSESSSEELIEENDFFNITLPAHIEAEIIPVDQLCTFCHLLLKQFKEQAKTDVRNFKRKLLAGCAQLQEQEKVDECTAGVTDSKLNKLSGNKSVTDLCVEEKLCKEGDHPNDVKPSFITPLDTDLPSSLDFGNKTLKFVPRLADHNKTFDETSLAEDVRKKDAEVRLERRRQEITPIGYN